MKSNMWINYGRHAALSILFGSFVLGSNPLTRAASGGGTGGGKIYFHHHDAGVAYIMNSDGSGKTPLPANVAGVPTRNLHGGHRWLLQTREIAGQFYPSGNQRREIFAVRDDGDENLTRQLTSQPDLERVGSLGHTRWATDVTFNTADGVVSWIARRWDLTTGTVIEGGIYAEEIAFDASGNVVGLAAQPTTPVVSAALVDTGDSFGLGPNIRDHDWSPSGSEVVFAQYSQSALHIADLSGATRLLLADSGFIAQPVWSPDGSKIAFAASGGIDSINPNGSKRVRIQKSTPWTSVYAPIWSPTGSHLAYRFTDRRISTLHLEVYRTSAGGGTPTNLTGDIGNASVFGWR